MLQSCYVSCGGPRCYWVTGSYLGGVYTVKVRDKIMSLPSRQVDTKVGVCVASAATIVPHHDSLERRANMCFWHSHCAIYARTR